MFSQIHVRKKHELFHTSPRPVEFLGTPKILFSSFSRGTACVVSSTFSNNDFISSTIKIRENVHPFYLYLSLPKSSRFLVVVFLWSNVNLLFPAFFQSSISSGSKQKVTQSEINKFMGFFCCCFVFEKIWKSNLENFFFFFRNSSVDVQLSPP